MNEPDIGDSLGDLERRVFLAIRTSGATNVAGVSETLARDGRTLAYTTVMTVMTRLWEKGYLVRRRLSKAYVYEARDQADIAGDLGARAAREALDKYGSPALMGFVRNLSPEQRATVTRLLDEESVPDKGHGTEGVDGEQQA